MHSLDVQGHFCYGWTLKQFFLHPMAGFRIMQLYLLWWLLWRRRVEL